MNDKIPVVVAIILLAFFAVYAAKMIQELEAVKELLAFYAILASGLFGLVTGAAMEKARHYIKQEKGGKD